MEGPYALGLLCLQPYEEFKSEPNKAPRGTEHKGIHQCQSLPVILTSVFSYDNSWTCYDLTNKQPLF
eukprot:4228311-Amphidinium_carterae.1